MLENLKCEGVDTFPHEHLTPCKFFNYMMLVLDVKGDFSEKYGSLLNSHWDDDIEKNRKCETSKS